MESRNPVVSNMYMRRTALSLWFLMASVILWAQPRSFNKTERTALQSAKNVLVSSLDRGLPKVSLEFFLQYEAGGAPIQWEVNDCGEQEGSAPSGLDSPMCVEADFQKDRTSVAVIVLVGTFTRGPSGIPALYRVTVAAQGGSSRRVRQLSDLPMELRRPAPRTPRDLPVPVTASSG